MEVRKEFDQSNLGLVSEHSVPFLHDLVPFAQRDLGWLEGLRKRRYEHLMSVMRAKGPKVEKSPGGAPRAPRKPRLTTQDAMAELQRKFGAEGSK